MNVTVVGDRLAGCGAAWALIVCSNTFKSTLSGEPPRAFAEQVAAVPA